MTALADHGFPREIRGLSENDSVKHRLTSLIEATRADELMITTMVYDHAARRRSYELLAEAFAITPPR